MNFKFNVLAYVICLASLAQSATAQHEVKPITDFLPDYQAKHTIILKAVEDTIAPLAVKLAMYERELSKLKNEFRTIRIQEYESKSISLAVRNSATSGSSGGVKKVDDKCVTAPSPDLYTKAEWMSVVGDNKGTYTSPNGNTACLKMSVAGKGTNAGILTAVFRYHPDKVLVRTERDTGDLFKAVAGIPL
jgi:hypothetical protein